MGGEVVGINTETFDGNQDAIKEAAAVLESQGAKSVSYRSRGLGDVYKRQVRNTAIFPLTLLPLQESMLPILWHFRPQS